MRKEDPHQRMTPDTLSNDNARETGEEANSPELKTQAKQSVRGRFAAQGLIPPAGSQKGGGPPPPPAKSPNFS
jgi:hypothetical protein